MDVAGHPARGRSASRHRRRADQPPAASTVIAWSIEAGEQFLTCICTCVWRWGCPWLACPAGRRADRRTGRLRELQDRHLPLLPTASRPVRQKPTARMVAPAGNWPRLALSTLTSVSPEGGQPDTRVPLVVTTVKPEVLASDTSP